MLSPPGPRRTSRVSREPQTLATSGSDCCCKFWQTASCGESPLDCDVRVRRRHCCRPCLEQAVRRPCLRRRGESRGLRMCRRCFPIARSSGPRNPVSGGNPVLACACKANSCRSPQTNQGEPSPAVPGEEAPPIREFAVTAWPAGVDSDRVCPPRCPLAKPQSLCCHAVPHALVTSP